jgi:RNA polymerase sigma-70 factor (ECF subfamily)
MVTAVGEVMRVRCGPELQPAAEESPARCSERELARRAGAGDREAFEEVYRRCHRQVYGVCLRMTRNVAEAEEITQEVFVHLFLKLGSFRGESALSTWVHRVAVNRVMMHFRRASARRDQITEDGNPPSEQQAPRFNAAGRHAVDRVALEAAVARLPPGYRAVFVLHDVEGYEHEEVARLCGISAGTSKSQLHKARARLRRLLGHV